MAKDKVQEEKEKPKSEFYFSAPEYKLGDPLLPGEEVPSCVGKCYKDFKINSISSASLKGRPFVVFFYPQDFTDCSEKVFGLIADMKASKEVDLEYIAISTDSIESHQTYAETRALGAPEAALVSDKNGNISRSFGVLDAKTHMAYNSLFLVDKHGVVQGSRVYANKRVPVVQSGMEDIIDTVLDALKE